MKTKITHLLRLFVVLPLFLGIAPTARTSEPLNRSSTTDVIEQLPSDLAIRVPTERRDRPFSATDVSSVPSVVQSPASDWQIECVDCPKQFSDMTDRSLRLDADGHPHIAYGGEHLYHAWYDGTRWHYETVDDSDGAGWYASLALDELGRPHISYLSSHHDGDLMYARYNGIDWHIERVDNAGDVSTFTSLALDELGWPHIVYQDRSSNALKYAQRDETVWHIETVDDKGYYASLALDISGLPHISYCNVQGWLEYAWHDGITWHTEVVDGSSVTDTSLALDGAGRPHISYSTNHDLKYAWYDGAAWHIERVDSTASVDWYTSLALDREGRPCISYYDSYPNYDLKYAWHDGAVWHLETVDSDGDAGLFTSLALDESGLPHISYYVQYNLRYARHDGEVWHIEAVESNGGQMGTAVSLALDEAEQPHIGYCDVGNHTLKYAWHDGVVWHLETVDSEGWIGGSDSGAVSLALDRSGRPHISYFDTINWDLKYAWRDETAWHTETVIRVGDLPTYASLALDKYDRPHIAYCLPGGRPEVTCISLEYAWHDGATWHFETVDDDSHRVGWYASLALDGMNRPHISYSAGWYHDESLKYAWRDGTTWHIETVTRGFKPSLALDRADHPHVSYYANEGLEYAWHDGANWHLETVPVGNVGDVGGGEISLALDGSDRPHISYYANGGVQHAQYDGMAWHLETVDSTRIAGLCNSLALDESDQPHVGYFVFSSYELDDLKYARLMPPLLNKQATPSDDLHNNDTLTYTLTLTGTGLSVRLWDPLPDAVHYVSGSITGTTTSPAAYSPTLRAVIWQGTLPTDTVQTVHFQVTPDITVTKSLSAPLPVVNTAWLTDTEHGRVISATAIVTIMPPPLTLKKQATPSDSLRNQDTLTYTLTLYGPDLRVRLRDPLPPSVRCVSDSITDTIGSISGTVALPAAVYSPTAHAVLWEGTLPTDTVEVIRFQVTPGITGTGSLSLSLPIINTAWLTATESGRSVSATVIVNGYHLYLPLVVRNG